MISSLELLCPTSVNLSTTKLKYLKKNEVILKYKLPGERLLFTIYQELYVNHSKKHIRKMNIKTTMRYTHLSEWLATKTQTTKRKIPYNIPYCRILKKKKGKRYK